MVRQYLSFDHRRLFSRRNSAESVPKRVHGDRLAVFLVRLKTSPVAASRFGLLVAIPEK